MSFGIVCISLSFVTFGGATALIALYLKHLINANVALTGSFIFLIFWILLLIDSIGHFYEAGKLANIISDEE